MSDRAATAGREGVPPSRSLAGGLPVVFRSVGFRLALNYGLLSLVTMTVLVALFYVQTVGVLKQNNARQVQASAYRLQSLFEREGRDGLARGIGQLLRDGAESDIELYLLLDERGTVLAGNMDMVPDLAMTSPRIVERPVIRSGRSVDGTLLVRQLADDSTLVVGREMGDVHRVAHLVERALYAAAGVTLLFILGGTAWFRAHLESRVEAIRMTTRGVGAGNLSMRIPATSEEDEFARLDGDINSMLDRIEQLMEGVRHVSNAIAHEMRTPMSRILAGLRTADRPDVEPDRVVEANRAAIREIETLTQVFDKLLQIAEAEAGTRRQEFERIDAGAIMRDVVELFASVAEEQGVTLVDETESPVNVLGDRDLLAGVAANLVENALRHAGSGARVRVGTELDGDDAVLSVTDDGPGVPAAALPPLGTRFFRPNRSVPGTGLGLASARAVVLMHGGTIDFAYARPGLAARVRLPAFVA